ncbi:MAG: hypothetical protein JW819_07060 [Candidatus Krumholzibacteriota bacterium]|nr:hypothetical protein [Candidatus Krumholzibacteriota bacterium]
MRRTVRVALFASLAAALGFLLAPVPNIELFTFCLFLAGHALGLAGGVQAALLAVLLFYGLNPYGSSLLLPPLLLSQLTASALIAGLGAAHARLLGGRTPGRWPARLLLLPFAVAAALALPLLPAAALALATGGDLRGWLALGLLMTGWGLAFNLLVFLGSFAPLARQLRRLAAAGEAV